MKKGEYVYTPRFCSVMIEKVFRSLETAVKYGFVEPTYYNNPEYSVFGKHIGKDTMIFAAVKK
ncbi:hypothetical protein [Candidatus Pseudoscillospira sp. SGI.172]|uniref:hypothetical protein n=1 Tax=Candidatus Pseudoscillospira sp. SGI.172 TaxID=3420582 RepID=UPI001F447A0B|nr:hypothetical protein [Oscillibacter valericigenes]